MLALIDRGHDCPNRPHTQIEPLESMSLEARQLREMAAMAREEGEEEVSLGMKTAGVD